MKNKNNRIILQVIVVLVIVGAIAYIELNKPHNSSATAQDIQIQPGTNASSTASGVSSASISATIAAQVSADVAAGYPKAKEIADPTGFINSPNGDASGTPGAGSGASNAPFTLSQFAGNKVILLDFWTYSCINCERTIPYLNAWYAKYKDAGLVIVGIHTPEFDFEKNYANVAAAVKQYGIQYPVVLDSNMGTWDAYQNQYWPHEYLIDANGYVIHDHIGEGDYDVTEEAIQTALKARDEALGMTPSEADAAVPTGLVSPAGAVSMDPDEVQSPETYFGAERNEYLANGNQGILGSQTFTVPVTTPSTTTLQPNALYLGGTWDFQAQFAETAGTADKIIYEYDAKNVYFVASATSSPANPASTNGVKIDLKLDGVPQGSMTIKANKLYQLIQGATYGEHTLEIDVEGPGLDAYTFTFG